VAGERFKLLVQSRAVLGSAESRRLRRQGIVPGVLYGREEPISIAVGERELRAALTTEGGLNAVLDVVVSSGKTHPSVLKEFQRHPVRGFITHIDLQEVRLDRPIHATVPVTLIGEPAGAAEGGVLSQVTIEVNVEALPMEVPQHIEVDVSGLHVNDAMRLDAVQAPEGVTLLDDLETVIATVTLPSREEEPESEAAAEEGAEGEAGDESAEPTAEADAAAAESDAGDGDAGSSADDS
jgi:large subunit ribosomal protein L25